MKIPYTICFCLQNDHALMVYRAKKPNQHLWNGLGGKLEKGETPKVSVKREVLEDAGFSVDTGTLYFSGVVSWNKKETGEREGMYAFIADFPSDVRLTIKKDTDEGALDWKPLEWVCNAANREVVSNIPQFFPKMIEYNVPLHYECFYTDSVLKGIDVSSLPADLVLQI